MPYYYSVTIGLPVGIFLINKLYKFRMNNLKKVIMEMIEFINGLPTG